LLFRSEDAELFMETIRLPGNQQGCLLVQFPPSLQAGALPQLQALLAILRPYNWPLAVEFRHSSWYTDAVFELLNSDQVALVIQDIIMRFSQRMGLRPVKTTLQVDSIDESLRNQLWNTFIEDFYHYFSDHSFEGDSDRGTICKMIWTDFFGNRVDLIPALASGRVTARGVLKYIEEWFFNNATWEEVYDFIEHLSEIDSLTHNRSGFTDSCNHVLKKELSEYRILNQTIVQITTEEEIVAIEEALASTDAFKSVNLHLATALKFLAEKQSPDYRNSIKESISAVEAFCKMIAEDDKATLGKALAIIEKQYNLHPTLKEAYSKIYRYASDAGGI
jgi:hypothetical protein